MPSVTIVDPAAPLSASSGRSARSAGTTDAVVIGTFAAAGRAHLAPGAAAVDEAFGGRLGAALDALDAKGSAGEVLRIPTLGQAPFPLIVATGLGANARDAEAVRRGVGAALRTLTGKRRVHIAIDAPAAALAEGALLGSYTFTDYKSDANKPALRTLTITGERGAAAEVRRARVLADAVNTVRDLVNTPPNDLYPETFAARAAELAGAAGLDVDVLDHRALARAGYGGILGVGAGSARPPRLVRITYRAKRPVARVALVGKGITFDSGGLNLKTANMAWMKLDMGGAAAAIATTVAAAALRLPLDVVATVPMAENMPSGSSYRPSDVLTMYGGRTVEVADTDAEGRLILVDAITRALEDEPDYLLEVSTLTGGQMVALGMRVIGAMGEDELRDLVVAAGRQSGEAVWGMPLPDDLRAGLDSPVADLQNLPEERWGSMLVAGLFLKEFMSSDVPWVHLDIAGPAWNPGGPRDYTPKGATGAGVRTLLAALERLAAG